MAESVYSNLVWGRPVPVATLASMSELRIVDLNLIYILKEKILPINGYTSRYSETVQPGTPMIDPDTGFQVTPYTLKHQDLVYYNPDPANPALTGLLVVPTISNSGNLAKIDYPEGVIYYSGIASAAINVTYDTYTVFVQDGYPEIYETDYDFAKLPVPLVSVDFLKRNNDPFQIGGGYYENRTFIINVLANSDPQRDDILDVIETSLRYTITNTINYNYGFPILYDGTPNPLFDRGAATRWQPIRFNKVSSRVMRDPQETEKLRHQAVLVLDILMN